MRFAAVCVLLAFVSLLAAAQDRPIQKEAMSVFVQDTLGQIADGEFWTTEITLMNLNDGPATYTLKFYGDNGQPLQLPFVGFGIQSQFSGSLPVLGSITYKTAGTSTPVKQGWAEIQKSPSSIGGMAIFRRSLPGIPPFEAVVPMDHTVSTRAALPFDHTNGYVTGLAITNASTYSSLPLFLTFRDQTGASFLLTTMTLAPMEHTAFVVSSRFPDTNNRVGLLDISTPSYGMVVLGLRFHPGGAFTTAFPMEGLTW